MIAAPSDARTIVDGEGTDRMAKLVEQVGSADLDLVKVGDEQGTD